MFVLPDDLPLELTPFAFLVGTWEGSGVISERFRDDPASDQESVSHEFVQRIEFAHNGQNYLSYQSTAKILDDPGLILPSEIGFWRLDRPVELADAGPGLLPGRGESKLKTHDDLEQFRNERGGFNISASILHPTGISEHYVGQIKGARVDLQTQQGLVPAAIADELSPMKPYGYAERMYGSVESALLWVWEVREFGKPDAPLVPLASARLERIA